MSEIVDNKNQYRELSWPPLTIRASSTPKKKRIILKLILLERRSSVAAASSFTFGDETLVALPLFALLCQEIEGHIPLRRSYVPLSFMLYSNSKFCLFILFLLLAYSFQQIESSFILVLIFYSYLFIFSCSLAVLSSPKTISRLALSALANSWTFPSSKAVVPNSLYFFSICLLY